MFHLACFFLPTQQESAPKAAFLPLDRSADSFLFGLDFAGVREQAWSAVVAAVREGGSAVNLLSMAQTCALADALEALDRTSKDDSAKVGMQQAEARAVLAVTLQGLDPAALSPQRGQDLFRGGAQQQGGLVNVLTGLLIDAWRARLAAANLAASTAAAAAEAAAEAPALRLDARSIGRAGGGPSAEARVKAAAAALDQALAALVSEGGPLLPRLRAFPNSRAGPRFEVAGATGRGGGDARALVRLVLANGMGGALDSAMSAFSRRGELPEWHTSLVCHRGTDPEQLANFVRRACFVAPANHQEELPVSRGRLHVLLGADRLPMALQHQVLDLLRQATAATAGAGSPGGAGAELLLTADARAGDGGHQGRAPLVAQLGGFRSVEETLPEPQLRAAWAVVVSSSAAASPPPVSVLSSAASGAGKSFAARMAAAETGALYCHCRVNRSLLPGELADLIAARISQVLAEEGRADETGADEPATAAAAAAQVATDPTPTSDGTANSGGSGVGGGGTSSLSDLGPNEDGGEGAPVVLVHLDLAGTVSPEMDRALIELFMTGRLAHDGARASIGAAAQGGGGGDGGMGLNPAPGAPWWWDPRAVRFVVEVAPGPLLDSLAALQWLPCRTFQASAATFAADRLVLERGFGNRAFRSERGDGTAGVLSGSAGKTLPKRVVVVGLQGTKASALNGCVAVVSALDDASGKWSVTIDDQRHSGRKIRAKLPPHNLRPIEAGDEAGLVQVHVDSGGGGGGAHSDPSEESEGRAVRSAWERWHRGLEDRTAGGSADAWARLQFVCGALDLLEQLDGRLPLDLELVLNLAIPGLASSGGPLSTEAPSNDGEAAAVGQGRKIDGNLRGLPGQRCFALLTAAMGTKETNFFALWAFVNGLYFQLKASQIRCCRICLQAVCFGCC